MPNGPTSYACTPRAKLPYDAPAASLVAMTAAASSSESHRSVGTDDTPSSAGDVQVGAKVKDFALGSSHVCVIRENDDVSCWGLGSGGQLGYGSIETIGDNEMPADPGGLPIKAKNLGMGTSAGCAVRTNGSLTCWGGNGAYAYALQEPGVYQQRLLMRVGMALLRK